MRRQYLAKPMFKNSRFTVLTGLMSLVSGFAPVIAQADVFSSITEIALPVAPGAHECPFQSWKTRLPRGMQTFGDHKLRS